MREEEREVRDHIDPQTLLNIYAQAQLRATSGLSSEEKFKLIELDQAANPDLNYTKYQQRAATILDGLQRDNAIQNWLYCRALSFADMISLDFLILRPDNGVVGLNVTSDYHHGWKKRNKIKSMFGQDGLSQIGVLQFLTVYKVPLTDEEARGKIIRITRSLSPIIYMLEETLSSKEINDVKHR